jgi:hypothetical protein
MDQHPETLSLDAAANLLKVGVPTVQSLINRGMLTAKESAGETVVAYDEILRFLRADQRQLLDNGAQPADLGLLSGGET